MQRNRVQKPPDKLSGPSCNEILRHLWSLLMFHLSYLAHHIHTSRECQIIIHLGVQAGISFHSQLENSLFPKPKWISLFFYCRFHQTQRSVRLIFLQTKVNDNQPLPDLVEELSGEISDSRVKMNFLGPGLKLPNTAEKIFHEVCLITHPTPIFPQY